MTGDYIRQLQLTKQLEQRAREAAANRKAAEEKIAEAEKALAKAKDFGAETAETEKLLVEATAAFSKKDYKGALGQATKSLESAESAKRTKVGSIIASAEELIGLIQTNNGDSAMVLASVQKTRALLAGGQLSEAFALANSALDKADQYVNRRMADSFGEAQSLMLLAEGVGLKVDDERSMLADARGLLDDSRHQESIERLRSCLDALSGSLTRWVESEMQTISSMHGLAEEAGLDVSREKGLLAGVKDSLSQGRYEEALARLKTAGSESKAGIAKAFVLAFESLSERATLLKEHGADISDFIECARRGKEAVGLGDLAAALEAWRSLCHDIRKEEENRFLSVVAGLRPKMLIAQRLNVDMGKVIEVLDQSRNVFSQGDLRKATEIVSQADGILENQLKGYRDVVMELGKTKALAMEGGAYVSDMETIKELMQTSRQLLMSRDFLGSAAQLRSAQKELHNQIQSRIAKAVMETELRSAAAMKMGADVSEEGALLDEIVKTVREGNYVAVTDIINRCSSSIEGKMRSMAEGAVSAASNLVAEYEEYMDVASFKPPLQEAVDELRSGEYDKAHADALSVSDRLKRDGAGALESRLDEAFGLLNLAKELGSESITLREKLEKAREAHSQGRDIESFRTVNEVMHFARSIVRDELARSLGHVSRSIAMARKSGVEVGRPERLTEEASRAIAGNDLEKADGLVREAGRTLEKTVALHNGIYDRIVEISELLEEAASHGTDTSTAQNLLAKTKRIFENGRYEEAATAAASCHEETEKIRDLIAITKRIKIDTSSAEGALARAESQINAGDHVGALASAKEAEKEASALLASGVSNEIANAKSLLDRAKSSGVDVRNTEAIIKKAESLLAEKRYNDALRAAELARSELDQSLVMERKATEQMEKAEALIGEVQAFGVDVFQANEILKQAGTYRRIGRHGIAVELAKKAGEQAAQAARAKVQQELGKVEMNYKSLQLEGPDLETALRIRDEIMQLLEQRRFRETSALARTMAAEVERVQAQKKQSGKALQDLRKKMEEARRRGLRSDTLDTLFARADEKMRGGSFSEAFALAIRCGEELRSTSEMFDKRGSELEAMKKDLELMEKEGFRSKDAAALIKNAEEALSSLDFEKTVLNIQRARVAIDAVTESATKERLRELQKLTKMALQLRIDEKAMPPYLRKLISKRQEALRASDMPRIRELGIRQAFEEGDGA